MKPWIVRLDPFGAWPAGYRPLYFMARPRYYGERLYYFARLPAGWLGDILTRLAYRLSTWRLRMKWGWR